MKFGKGAREMRALFHFKIRNYVARSFLVMALPAMLDCGANHPSAR
jgi:hypothetical protein